MYLYLCIYIYIYIWLYIYMHVYSSLYIYAPGTVSGGVEECTLNKRLLIYRYISVYISVCLLPSAAVWESAH